MAEQRAYFVLGSIVAMGNLGGCKKSTDAVREEARSEGPPAAPSSAHLYAVSILFPLLPTTITGFVVIAIDMYVLRIYAVNPQSLYQLDSSLRVEKVNWMQPKTSKITFFCQPVDVTDPSTSQWLRLGKEATPGHSTNTPLNLLSPSLGNTSSNYQANSKCGMAESRLFSCLVHFPQWGRSAPIPSPENCTSTPGIEAP